MPRPVIWFLIAAPTVLIVTFLTLMALDSGAGETGPAAVRVSGEADIRSEFTLVNQDGETVTNADFEGRPLLVYFGYTFCPDVCPFSLQVMDSALAQLDARDRARFQPVLISVDPARDTVEQMATYVTSPAFPDGLVGLTGTEDQVAAAAAAFRVGYRVHDDEGGNDYLVDHTSLIFLMDADGRFADVFSPTSDPREIAARLQSFLEESGASS